MSWTGRSTLVWLVAVFAIAMAGVLPGVARASILQGETPLFYPSFPTAGGPYILAATYDAQDEVVRVVFSEEIDPGTVGLDDFVFEGFGAEAFSFSVSNRVVVLSDLTDTVNPGVDLLYLADVGVIDDAAGDYSNSDVDQITVTTGPVMVYAEISNWLDFDADDDLIDVYFDDAVELNSSPFDETPELAGADLDLTVAGNRVSIELDSGSTHFRQNWPGISKIWLRAGGVEWDDDTVVNSVAQKRMIDNEDGGPILVGCYYNDVGDKVWVVFSEAVDRASLDISPSAQYDIAGGGFSGGATQALGFPGEYTNCVLVSDDAFAIGGGTIAVDPTHLLRDYQNEPGPQTAARDITTGMGVIRAVYDDYATATLVDDRLEVWFSEPIANVDSLGVVDSTDFHIDNLTDEVFTHLTIQATNEAGLGHVVFSGWQIADENMSELAGRLPVGHRFYIDAESDLSGEETEAGVDTSARLPILEGYRATAFLEENPELTNKIYDEDLGIDRAYLAWHETEGETKESGIPDTGDQFRLYSTWDDPAAFNDGFIRNSAYAQDAIPVANVGNGLLDEGVSRFGLSIKEGEFTTSDGHEVEDYDVVYFMLVPVTYWGEVGDFSQALVFEHPFVVGPVCPPLDFDDEDDDLIHVTATYDADAEAWTRFVTGDGSDLGGAAPCGDSLYVFDGHQLTDNVLGVGPIDPADGSFGPIELTAAANEEPLLYLRAWEDGAFSAALQIVNDITPPALTWLNGDGHIDIDDDGDADGDLFNPYRIYKAGDYVNIIVRAADDIGEEWEVLSDLLTLTGDFSAVDETAGSNAVAFVSMGADEIDNDGDWDDTSPNPTYDGNDIRDFPEPYMDENNNGQFDPGETFVDKDEDNLCDCIGGSDDEYDYYLDSADDDEHSFYEIQLDPAAFNDETKGYPLENPVTDPSGLETFAEMFDLPVGIAVTDPDLDATAVFEDAEAPFRVVRLDEVEPTVMRAEHIYRLASYDAIPTDGDDIYSPTDPVYNFGRFMSFVYGAPSDEDVLFGILEMDPGTGDFAPVTLDPPGDNADPVAPGILDFDDDRDGGIDSADVEVADAILNAATDHRDNDNDAYCTFEPYFDTDPLAVNPNYGRFVWYNIDEEGETYDPASDDNEDGIADGEAVQLTTIAARMVLDGDEAYIGPFYVDAAHVPGAPRPTPEGIDPDPDPRELTEIATPAWEVLDPNGVLSDAFPGLPFGDDAAYQVFDWFDIKGANIDLWQIAQLYGLETDGEDHGYRFRVVSYDQPGNTSPEYSVPFAWTADTTPPNLQLADCEGGTEDAPSLVGPPSFMEADIDDAPGVQIPTEGVYTLTTTDDGTADDATFYYRVSQDGGETWGAGWQVLDTDNSRPFTADFDASTLTIDNDPPDGSVLIQFRAIGCDLTYCDDVEDACVFQVEAIDRDPGICWFTLIHTLANPTSGPFWYRDVNGPVQVPVGPAIDIWADYDDNDGNEETNDILRAVFEVRQSGEGNEWTPFATQTGDIITDPETGEHTVDFTKPVAVTLDTEWLASEFGTGSFDIRVYVCDIEGNCNVATADMAMLTIVLEGLRAYIQEPVNTDPLQFDLYAVNYIHDYDIDYVTFQYLDDDPGSDWVTIDVDDVDTDRGDVLLYRGTTPIHLLANHVPFTALGGVGGEGFIDFDGDGYSDRDPIIRDLTAPFGEYSVGDEVVLGDTDEIDYGRTLTDFEAAEFHSGDAPFDAAEWIFQENGMQAPGALDLWTVSWDATGLEGEILVRAVATDETGATDSGDIPTTSVTLDTEPPVAAITQYVLPDGTEIDASLPDTYVPGSAGWMRIDGETADDDVANVLFQWSDDGGATWTDLDVNDDDDFYANIDGVPGLGAEDEVIRDNGDFLFGEGDVVLYAGANGETDTPVGTPLLPLIGEDPAGGGDTDNDGMFDEDGAAAPEDDDPEYFVYFIFPTFASDTNVLFRAIAEDESGNVDPDPATVAAIIGESMPPETDVVEAYDADGNEVDVHGDDADQIAGPTLDLLVTAEDLSAIDYVDLMWRYAASCYDLEPWDNPWRSMSADGYAEQDDTNPYNFTVDIGAMTAALGDGVFEFYPNAVDDNGNATPPPENPYLLRLIAHVAEITTPTDDVIVAPGDEFWFAADVVDPPSDAPAPPAVSFQYAERVMGEAIDATRIAPDPIDPTYMSLPLAAEMVNPANNAVLTVTVDEVSQTGVYHEDLGAVSEPTMLDWTYVDDAGDATGHVEFGAQPPADATIVVDYNVTGYTEIGTDWGEPYTTAWDAEDGGVPTPTQPSTNAYDVIALLAYRDGEFELEPPCALIEEEASEGAILLLTSEDAPRVMLYPYGTRNADPLEYWPGNPSFDSEAGLTEWKLSGSEHEFFVQAGAPDRDEMEITSASLIFSHGAETTTVPMTRIDDPVDHVDMTFTLYESDFPEVTYAFENVWLEINDLEMPMTEVSDGIWQIGGVQVTIGAQTDYYFYIDMDGDNYMSVVDPRNWTIAPKTEGPDGAVSIVSVPPAPFWYCAGIDFGDVTSVWHVQAAAVTADGVEGRGTYHTFVYDPVPPTVDRLWTESDRFRSGEVTVQAIVTDPTPPEFNAITVDEVIVQYSPNYSADRQIDAVVWLPFGTDSDPSDGWIVTGTIPAPERDGYDNNHNGSWNEPEESTSAMAFRAIAVDDGHNVGAPTPMEFILDDTPPEAVMTSPADGAAYRYGETFTVSADITESEEDIAHVLFEYDAGDGDDWQPVLLHPEDGTNPEDPEAPYEVEFNTALYLDEEDVYVRFRAIPEDTAGNEGTSDEVLVVVDDITGPTAYILTATTTGGDPMPITDPHTAVTGDEVGLAGIAVDPSGEPNLATVTVEYQDPDTDLWVTIGVINDLTPVDANTVSWTLTGWDVTGFDHDTMLPIHAIAADADGNTADAIPVSLHIDHQAPSVYYEPMDPHFAGFAPFAPYDDDGDDATQGRALTPNRETGDLVFAVVTPDEDVAGMILQYRLPGDPVGEWSDWTFTSDAFDIQTNLGFDGYSYWWLYIDDFADNVALSGVAELRVVATDYAGNANILHNLTAPEANPWETWTIDTDPPTQLDFHNDLTNNQVASGRPATLTLVAQDATSDVDVVRFEYFDDGAWWPIDGPTPVTGENVDTPYAQWTASVIWNTPVIYADQSYDVRAVFYDTAGNESFSETMTILVEDDTAPDVKLFAIAPIVDWVIDAPRPDSTSYVAECDDEEDHHDGLYVDFNNNDVYGVGDLAIDYGYEGDVLTLGDETTDEIGGWHNSWPRFIDETMLENELDLHVAREVTLVGRSQIQDTGLRQLEFYALTEDGGRLIPIGIDQCPPMYGTYLWHVVWNTLAIGDDGAPLYPDGNYFIVVIGEDQAGNREVVSTLDAPTVAVDNTAPLATMDADPGTEAVETFTDDVERNEPFALFARTESERDDDEVWFYVKRHSDLNVLASYWLATPGVDPRIDVNPDNTRPYAFEWNLNGVDPALTVGEQYDVVGVAMDIVDNAETPMAAWTAGRYITLEITDTHGPEPTITEVTRATGNTTTIEYPNLMGEVRARDFSELVATLLEGDTDAQRVEFMFRPDGLDDPTLIDAEIERDEDDPFTWHIHDWDLSTLEEGTYFVWARGWDDVGNFEDGEPFTLVVDRTAPEPTIVTPTDGMIACPHEEGGDAHYELIFTVTEPAWQESISWEVKSSAQPDDERYWNEVEHHTVFDADTGAYAGSWSLYDYDTGLYDVRLTFSDESGNETRLVAARNVVVDREYPDVDVTRVVVGGEDVYPTEAVEISAGDVITLYATASDDEQGLPVDFETGVTQVIFEARYTPSGEWYQTGLWTAPVGTLFTEVSHSIDWNTSGLSEGSYEVQARAIDAECNEAASSPITVVIRDIEAPRARIAGFYPWNIGHGDDVEDMVDIYAMAYSDADLDEVQFQYSLNGTDWIPIGITTDLDDDGDEFCDLWYTTMALDGIGLGTEFELRAIASDGDGNQDPENAPTVSVTVVMGDGGMLTLSSADLGVAGDPVLNVLGGSEDCSMLVEVTMAEGEMQRPLVMWVEPEAASDEGDAECVEMTRAVDNPLVWRGTLEMDHYDCGRSTVFVTALSGNAIDLGSANFWSYEVTAELGTNGVVSTPGYVHNDTILHGTAQVPPGNGGLESCLLVAPAMPPMLNQDEAFYLAPIARTAYHIGMICDDDHGSQEPEDGFWMTASIEYDAAALEAAMEAAGIPERARADKEQYITVRRFDAWGVGAWSSEYIEQVSVDIENNRVEFVVTDVDENIYALFVPTIDGPVVVQNFVPSSPYTGRWNYTDRDPEIIVDLNGENGNDYDEIDESSIEMWIDGRLVANDGWVLGAEEGAEFIIESKNDEDSMYQLTYRHADDERYWLTDGAHTLNVRFKLDDGDDYRWNSLLPSAAGATFFVDATAPVIQLYSGYTSNPALHSSNPYELNGYLNPDNANDMLTVYMYDGGSGILVRPPDQDHDGHDHDLLGIKYDLWLVENENRMHEVDEYEERLLLHTGTADELVPYLNPPLVSADPDVPAYSPEDTLFVGLRIVAGGHQIHDGDVLELVLYTDKDVVDVDDQIEFDCEGGIIVIPDFEDGVPDTLGPVHFDCYIYEQHMHVYEQGILDWAGNSGSEYVESRFVIDMTAPEVVLVSPAGGVTSPNEQFCFTAELRDGGSGVGTAQVALEDSHGAEITVENVVITSETVSGCVPGGLANGRYSLTVTVTDQAGNTRTVSIPITVESPFLALTRAHVYPNPFNPSTETATIAYSLSHAADVTIKAYDFAGEFVGTLVFGQAGQQGVNTWTWAGQTGDGTPLANGAYLLRIEVYDGSARKSETVKAVIWRE